MEKCVVCRWLEFFCGLPFLLLVACHGSNGFSETDQECFLELQVSTGQMKGGGNGGVIAEASAEKSIRSIYVYAFDDNYPDYVRDYYAEDKVNDGLGELGKYRFKMKIYGIGHKRFYVFVNPPQYVRRELAKECPENRLKSLTLYQYKPFLDVKNVQQSIENAADVANPTGFPMSNYFEADLKGAESNPSHMLLFPLNGHCPIDEIPLFRSFGKISVEAQLKNDAMSVPVDVTKIDIFNYTGNGLFLSEWQGKDFWISGGQSSIWNMDMKMNLEKMAIHETRVFVDPFLLLSQPVRVDKTSSWTPLGFCYLCQNSYGRQENLDAGMQNGLEDVIGNRISQMRITLSDGRENTVLLPFLCRNDHLKVKFVISRNVLQVYFEKWQELEVHPDWNDEIL